MVTNEQQGRLAKLDSVTSLDQHLMKPTALNVDDHQAMVRMFHGESDRGAAVLAGSYIENYLGTFLESKMVDRDKALRERIFGSNGPLSSFSQRIDFAQGFGFMNALACSHMHSIRKIRNHFAHHPKEASFTESPVTDLIRKISDGLPPLPDGDKIFPALGGRDVYLVTIGLLLFTMQGWGVATKIAAPDING